MPSGRRILLSCALAVAIVIFVRNLAAYPYDRFIPKRIHYSSRPLEEILLPDVQTLSSTSTTPSVPDDDKFHWANVPQNFPIPSPEALPTGNASPIPRIQKYPWPEETMEEKAIREERRAAVFSNFTHAWEGYKKHAWMHDEVKPLTGGFDDPFGGWAATLVDSLDTLLIMGLEREFEEAVEAVGSIDFSNSTLLQLNVFETTIRYLGGLLSAHDLSRGKYPVLLEQARELGEMIYKSFDTPNHMPITRWDWMSAKNGMRQQSTSTLLAELGSFTLELTRLSQVTGDNKYYDVAARVMEALAAQQMNTKLPGMFTLFMNTGKMDFANGNGDMFTLGGMADSMYEYLPKQHLLLNGQTDLYSKIYSRALEPVKNHLIFRPMLPPPKNPAELPVDILIPGQASVTSKDDEPVLDPRTEHLTCFVGGMVGLAARAFGTQHADDMALARRVTDGCIWAYKNFPLGIMPEIFHLTPCPRPAHLPSGTSANPSLAWPPCEWQTERWHGAVRVFTSMDTDAALAEHTPDEVAFLQHLPKGVASVDDPRYILRPEAIESLFVLYRLTGDRALLDDAWHMFKQIIMWTRSEVAHAGLGNVMLPGRIERLDKMESFWTAETLKYFYLVFSPPDLISLDEFVLNTEAHPLRWREAEDVARAPA